MTEIRSHHLALTCRDPIAVERFYTRHFGFTRARVIDLGDGAQIVFLKSPGLYLELFRAERESPDAPPTADGYHWPGFRHIAFKVDNVDAKLAEMAADAVPTLGPLDFDAFIPGWRSVWLQDPEGNIVEISQGYVDQDAPPALPPE